MGLAINDEGWYVPTVGKDGNGQSGEGSGYSGEGSRLVYCSDTDGNDLNTGTQASPVKTIDKMCQLVRNNYPDWGLLKCGDTWTDQQLFINGGGGTRHRSGYSATERLVFTSYGAGARPLLRARPGFPTSTSGYGTSGFIHVTGGGGGSGSGQNMLVNDIEFYGYTRDPDSPDYNSGDDLYAGAPPLSPPTMAMFSSLTAQNNIMIQGCKAHFLINGVSFNAAPAEGSEYSGCQIHRNVIANNCYPNDTHLADTTRTQGIWVQGHTGFKSTENIIFHNGWFDHYDELRTEHNHGHYHSASASNDWNHSEGNLYVYNSAHGNTMNHGGLNDDNFYFRNAIGFNLKNRKTSDISYGRRNVILLPMDYVAGENIGWGITFGTLSALRPGTIVIDGNIVAHTGSAGANETGIAASGSPAIAAGTVTISNNIIYDMDGAGIDAAGQTLSNNQDEEAGYVAPERTIGEYMGRFGHAATEAAFFAALMDQRQGNWRRYLMAKQLNAWFRHGFRKSANVKRLALAS
jgi:hypothetical protein